MPRFATLLRALLCLALLLNGTAYAHAATRMAMGDMAATAQADDGAKGVTFSLLSAPASLDPATTVDGFSLMVETQLFSRKMRLGGTCDMVARINGETWLIDFKTSNGLYKTHEIQLAAYKE